MNMKKFMAIISVLLLIIFVGGCLGPGSDRYDDNTEVVTPSDDNEQNKEDCGMENDSIDAERADVVIMSCGDNYLEIALADTVSARALADRLVSGDITVTMHEYGGFEMVGALRFSLDREDVNMTTDTGDVVLYSGNQLVVFFDSNTWAYTQIGCIKGATKQTLYDFFGSNNEVNITLSLK